MMRWFSIFFLILLIWLVQVRVVSASDWKVISRISEQGGHQGLQFEKLSVAVAGSSRKVTVDLVLFDDRNLQLEVVDNPVEPRLKLAEAMDQAGAVAGVNGGFFHPDYRPAGMLVSGGKTVAKPEKASLLSGAVVAEPSGKVRVLRYRELGQAEQWAAGIQAGPFLVDGGQSVQGLKNGKLARRTIFISDGQHRHGLVMTGPMTLPEAAAMLTSIEMPDGMGIERALNLDGGSSSGIWVARGDAVAYYQAEWGHVRNFLALIPK